MSAAANAAGYLYASGILTQRRDNKALASTPAARWVDESAKNALPIKPAPAAPKITYKKRRLP